METKTISTRMHSLVVLYDMHTTFFKKAIEGISIRDANNRLNTKANHMAWLTGSLVEQRYELAGYLGIEGRQQAANELFANHKGIQDSVAYPPLQAFVKDWESIAPILREALVNATDEKLDSPFNMPGMEMKFFELVAFIIYREANCIGQLALWRRLLGYEGIKYE